MELAAHEAFIGRITQRFDKRDRLARFREIARLEQALGELSLAFGVPDQPTADPKLGLPIGDTSIGQSFTVKLRPPLTGSRVRR